MRFPRNMLSNLIASALLSGSFAVHAATVAIIDSGVDYKHKDLAATMWTNPTRGTTDDAGNSYQDDTHGWNFAENNNQIIDYKYLGTFSQDCYKIFEIQGKILRGIATQQEKDWYKAHKEDENFLKELQKFGNFVHGTHVAGTSSEQSTSASLVALKLIPTETPGAMLPNLHNKAANPLVTMMLGIVAKRQADVLIKTGKYTNAVGAKVANGSFGTSVTAVKPIVAQLAKQLTGQDPSEADVDEYAKTLVNDILDACKGFPAASPGTLFVFAAGNDGTDNDTLPTSPANIKLDNTISVAATMGAEKLASFSNYGATMVDVAAPGVVIRSTIPGDQYLELSGTSMAAPYVTNVAARLTDANPSLNPAGIKRIIMDTVDVMPWLQGKVKSGGIINAHRALIAAELSQHVGIDEAIKSARAEVANEVHPMLNISPEVEKDLLVLPMPALFQ